VGFPSFKAAAADLQHIGSHIIQHRYRHTHCCKLRTGRPPTECDSHIQLDPTEQSRRSSGARNEMTAGGRVLCDNHINKHRAQALGRFSDFKGNLKFYRQVKHVTEIAR
jgi:hypothetical protein